MEDFEQLPHQRAHANSVFVVDDIHWSVGRRKAWKRIKAHPRVTVTIDLYDLGLVFFRNRTTTAAFPFALLGSRDFNTRTGDKGQTSLLGGSSRSEGPCADRSLWHIG